MKRKILTITAISVSIMLAMSSYQSGTHGSLGNRTGSNGGSDGCNSCHGNSANAATTVNIALLQAGNPVTTYTPGQTYTVRLTGQNTGNARAKFGFQMTAANASGTAVGTMATNGVSGVALRASNTLIEHSQPLDGTLGSPSDYTYTRDFSWTAPAAGTGAVKFFAVLNAVNGNGNDDSNGGDQWNKGQSVSITEVTNTSIPSLEGMAKIQLYPNPSGNELKVDLANAKMGTYDFEIIDISGRSIKHEKHIYSSQGQVMKADISKLKSGQYFLKLNNGESQTTLKFQKL